MILPFSPHLPTLFQGFPSYTKVQCNLPTAAAVEAARRVPRHNWTSKSSWKATELLGALDATGKTMECLCFFGYYLYLSVIFEKSSHGFGFSSGPEWNWLADPPQNILAI